MLADADTARALPRRLDRPGRVSDDPARSARPRSCRWWAMPRRRRRRAVATDRTAFAHRPIHLLPLVELKA
ncbi:MAG: hypothetical protein R2713_01810 [Ilumatobacteraceae bacterium]